MTLQQLIAQYVTFRRALGEKCRTNAQMLRQFAAALGPHVEPDLIAEDQVSAFLVGAGPLTSTYFVKLTALRGFYRWATSRGHVTTVPLPKALPRRPPAFVPYIYSLAEIRLLLDATDSYQRGYSLIEPDTLRTLLLLLYGTGLRLREALSLRRQDVDFAQSLLTVKKTKFYKSRLVPFGPQLGAIVSKYAARALPDAPACGADSPLLSMRTGAAVKAKTCQNIFRLLCTQAGLRRTDGARYQPRLHDLRHTFAVHRLTCWYRQGLDVQALLPHLSVYLGHAYLSSTQVYLSMTPELLTQAQARFEHYAFPGDANE